MTNSKLGCYVYLSSVPSLSKAQSAGVLNPRQWRLPLSLHYVPPSTKQPRFLVYFLGGVGWHRDVHVFFTRCDVIGSDTNDLYQIWETITGLGKGRQHQMISINS